MPASQLYDLVLSEVGGWVLVIGILLWEFYAPKILNRETALSPLLHDVPEQVEDLSETQDELQEDVCSLEGNLEEVAHSQEMVMQVQRAQARANPQMDHKRVDKYLHKNGANIDNFLHGDEMTGYSNWTRADGGQVDDDE